MEALKQQLLHPEPFLQKYNVHRLLFNSIMCFEEEESHHAEKGTPGFEPGTC